MVIISWLTPVFGGVICDNNGGCAWCHRAEFWMKFLGCVAFWLREHCRHFDSEQGLFSCAIQRSVHLSVTLYAATLHRSIQMPFFIPITTLLVISFQCWVSLSGMSHQPIFSYPVPLLHILLIIPRGDDSPGEKSIFLPFCGSLRPVYKYDGYK